MSERFKRIIAFYLAINIFFEVVSPTVALALTGGPSQPEVQAFTPVSTSDMVSAFTGDFNYNIPLLDVDGYPINLAYDAGIGMDQEASWVGLGWNINPGTISRNMRGLPDDFKDDIIHKELTMKPNQTFGISTGVGVQVVGADIKGPVGAGTSKSYGLSYNNYNGWAVSKSSNSSISVSNSNKATGTFGLGVSAGSGQGLGITTNASFSNEVQKATRKNKGNIGLGIGYNSIAGLGEISMSANFSSTKTKTLNKTDKAGNAISVRADYERGLNGGFGYSFASPTYLPFGNPNMLNMSLNIGFTFGFEMYFTHPNFFGSAYYSGSFIKDPSQDYYAYGYLNSSGANNGNNDNILHDFNREKDVAFTMHTPDLPVTNYTFDNFTYTGQGIGGNFRPKRRDIGSVFDPKVKNEPDIGMNSGVEVGVGNAAHVGFNLQVSVVNSYTSKWMDDNQALGKTRFNDDNIYFKQGGEKTAETDMSYFNNVIGGFEPVTFDILGNGANHYCSSDLINKNHNTVGFSNPFKSGKVRVNEAITVLNGNVASVVGVEKQVKSYPESKFDLFYDSGSPNQPVTITGHPGHHIAEITTTRPDGARYVYGIAAYNNKQTECTFAKEQTYSMINDAELGPLCQQGIDYVDGTDNSQNNKQGLDNYYSKENMPGYAHSYLLTAVLSADYVDRTGNGPSKDDYGTYTKFNYTRIQSDYKWRTPYSKANFDIGYRSKNAQDWVSDDKASYIYGEKEIWMLHSIETKNYVAEFVLNDDDNINNRREDAYAVAGEVGGIGSQRLRKLQEIKLFSRQELIDKGTAAIPLKVVHFEYDYSLCPGTLNNSNGGGKLTLKKVWFTYQGSQKGKLSPYEFSYGDNDHDGTPDAFGNPEYDLKDVDRWGNFKPNTPNYANNNNEPNNADFPYSEQTDLANQYATAWNLSSVKLPSGGEIKVSYEADDYAFVQDKKAMQMFTVAGVSGNAEETPASDLFSHESGELKKNNHIKIILSQEELNKINQAPNPSIYIRDTYFRDENGNDIKYLYFNFLVNLERKNRTPKRYEYVRGYTYINFEDDHAPTLVTVNGVTYLDFLLKEVQIFDNKVLPGQTINPITMAGINMTRRNLPQIAYDNVQDPDMFPGDGSLPSISGLLTGVKSAFTPVLQFFQGGLAQALINANASAEFLPQRSFVRLYCPSKAKKGGGYRVKEVRLNDHWNTLTNEANNKNVEYGQEYIYQKRDANHNLISSGVSTYEPLVGADENPWKQPVFYEEKHILAPDDDYYLEEPFGESMFPGPSVGYSQVIVRNIQRQKGTPDSPINLTRHATGAVVHEYYTFRDFPTIAERTNLSETQKRHKPNPIAKFLKFFSRDYMTAAQGYQIILNDMHGKEKAQWVYPELTVQNGSSNPVDLYNTQNKNYISGVEYKYKRDKNRLVNYSDVVFKDGKVQNTLLGVDYDMIVDTRESQTSSNIVDLQANVDLSVIPPAPVTMPMIYPTYKREKLRFRSAVVTKVLYQYGLLEETVAYSDGASVATRNLLHDAETGEVLLTQTTNTYSDPIYNLTYPAHWTYDRMGQACKNNMAYSSISSGVFSNPGILTVGDELYMKQASGSAIKAWVFAITPNILIMDQSGNYVNLNDFNYAKVVRSGNRNQQNIPVASVVSLSNPIVANSIQLNNKSKVINASAAEYREDWGLFCNCDNVPGSVKNPFVSGQKGNFRPLASYAYLTGREQSKQNNNTNIRQDGPYKTFVPFWTANANSLANNWTKTTDPSWQYTTRSTIYSPFGVELENVDALNRYSAALYGYNNSLPIAVSSNAKYKQIGNDNFEEYDYNNPCDNNHFTYQQYVSAGTEHIYGIGNTNDVKKSNSSNQKHSHTGRRSFKIEGGQPSVILTRTITSACQ